MLGIHDIKHNKSTNLFLRYLHYIITMHIFSVVPYNIIQIIIVSVIL